MSENETTNAQDGQQDTAARVMECWRKMCSWVAIDAKEHDDRGVREYAAGLQAKADALRPELERLLARPTVSTVDSDTAQRVAEIREREQKATDGPWRTGWLASYNMHGRPVRYVYRGDGESVNTRLCVNGGEGDEGKEFDCDADAAFIAHARADVPWLLDTVDALLAERDAARAECERLREERDALPQ